VAIPLILELRFMRGVTETPYEEAPFKKNKRERERKIKLYNLVLH
jgi:hypothetical protein